MSRSRTIGTRWESAIAAFLVEHGFPYAERRALAGANDKGDITGIPGVVIEAKAERRISLSEFLNEAEKERDNAGAHHGAAWIKRPKHTSPGRAYVLMSGDDYVKLLREAGYSA